MKTRDIAYIAYGISRTKGMNIVATGSDFIEVRLSVRKLVHLYCYVTIYSLYSESIVSKYRYNKFAGKIEIFD